MMSLKEHFKSNQRLKDLAHFLLKPRGEYRPRWWVRLFLNPFRHTRRSGSIVRRSVRKDLFPYNNFYLGTKSLVEDFATLNNAVGDIHIGERSLIGIGCVLIGPVFVDDDVMLAQNVVVSGLNHNYENVQLPISKQSYSTRPIHIGAESWIGANSVITAGVQIGKHCVVAAGSVVTKNVPPYSVVGGNPAKILKQYNHDSGEWEKITKMYMSPNRIIK